MPKYNLIDNEELEKSEKDDAQEPEQGERPEETSISNYILDDLAISDPDMDTATAAPEDEFNIPPPMTTNGPHQESTPPVQPIQQDVLFQDEKQPGINFKPVKWIIAAVVAVILIYLAIDNFILSDGTEEPAEQIETPEERMARERETQKQNLLATMNQEKQTRMQYLSNLLNIKPADVKYSSFLLYANSLSFEAFAKDRSGLAKLNMQLKASPALAGYVLETAANRPGTRGGVFALYVYQSLQSGSSKAPSQEKIPTMDGKTWLNQNIQKFGMQVAGQRQVSSNREQLFNVIRQEYILKGSEEACFGLLKSMAGIPANYAIHKLVLVPVDQRNIMKSNYQLTLVMDFYL